MSALKNLKKKLTGAVALIAIMSVAPAMAATISTATNTTQTLGAGDTLIVTNSGSVSGTNPAAEVSGVAAIAIDNSGTLDGTTTGVSVSGAGGDLISGVTNSGDIYGGGYGVSVDNAADISGGLVNSGLIEGSGHGSVAIKVTTNSDVSGGITNSGELWGWSGILVETSDISGGINIQAGGTITGILAGIGVTTGDISGGISNSGTIDGGLKGIDFLNSVMTGNITNNLGGTIIGNNAITFGASTLTGQLDNYGTISGNTGILATTNADIQGTVTNHAGGLIDVDWAGIEVRDNSDISGGVVNNGTISVAGGDTAYGIWVSNAKISGGIINTGTISGADAAIKLDSLTGLTPININGGRIIGDVIDDTPSNGFSNVTIGGNFSTEGNFDVSDLTVSSGKTLTISAGNTITLDRMSASAGTFNIEVDSTSSFGKLVVNGAGKGLNLTGAKVTVSVAAGNIADGDELLVGDGAAAITGGPGATKTSVADDSLLWDFEIADGTAAAAATDNTDLFLFVSQAVAIDQVADSPNNVEVGEAIQELAASPDANVQQVLAQINAASNEKELNEVLEKIQPDVGGGAVAGALNVSNASLNVVGNRLASLNNDYSGSGIAAGNLAEGIRIWSQGFGSAGDQDERDGVAGFESDCWGIAVGADTENIRDDAVVGVAFSYSDTDVDSKASNNASTDVESYQVTLYGDYDVSKNTHVSAMAAYGRHVNATARVPLAGVVAKGDFDAESVTLRSSISYDYQIGRAKLSPNALVHWTHYDPDSYTETGAGGLGLTVEGDAMDILEAGAGVTASWDHQTASGGHLVPEVRAGARYDMIGDEITTTSSFIAGGSSFQTKGFDPAQTTVSLGAGAKYYSTDNWEFTANYDFEYKSDYESHAGFVKMAYKF